MSTAKDLETIELAFDVLNSMDFQHEFEDFCVVHIPKDLMDKWDEAQADWQARIKAGVH